MTMGGKGKGKQGTASVKEPQRYFENDALLRPIKDLISKVQAKLVEEAKRDPVPQFTRAQIQESINWLRAATSAMKEYSDLYKGASLETMDQDQVKQHLEKVRETARHLVLLLADKSKAFDNGTNCFQVMCFAEGNQSAEVRQELTKAADFFRTFGQSTWLGGMVADADFVAKNATTISIMEGLLNPVPALPIVPANGTCSSCPTCGGLSRCMRCQRCRGSCGRNGGSSQQCTCCQHCGYPHQYNNPFQYPNQNCPSCKQSNAPRCEHCGHQHQYNDPVRYPNQNCPSCQKPQTPPPGPPSPFPAGDASECAKSDEGLDGVASLARTLADACMEEAAAYTQKAAERREWLKELEAKMETLKEFALELTEARKALNAFLLLRLDEIAVAGVDLEVLKNWVSHAEATEAHQMLDAFRDLANQELAAKLVEKRAQQGLLGGGVRDWLSGLRTPTSTSSSLPDEAEYAVILEKAKGPDGDGKNAEANGRKKKGGKR